MNRIRFAATAGIAALVALCVASSALAGTRGWLQESETVTRQFALADATGPREVVIDNVMGSVDVRVGGADRVEISVKQLFSAADAEEMARARREVRLEVLEKPGRLELLQGGPWRCENKRHRDGGDGNDWESGNCCCGSGWDDRDWEVRFDWTVTVPKNVDLTVKSVNDGTIRVDGVAGRLRVRHVNDDVTIANVAGRVDARTVNGELKVDFVRLPDGDSSFATVNGDIDLGFPRGLGAELTFATLNGEVYTDFPFTLAKNPPPPPASERDQPKKGRHRHELGRRTAATLGQGGVAIDCDTVNGDITIRERS
jgi:hypothetical protein